MRDLRMRIRIDYGPDGLWSLSLFNDQGGFWCLVTVQEMRELRDQLNAAIEVGEGTDQ